MPHSLGRTTEETEAFIRHVVRVHDRYANEVVERFRLCPWAARAKGGGTCVLLGDPPADAVVEAIVRGFGEGEQQGATTPEVLFVVLPEFSEQRSHLEALQQAVSTAQAVRKNYLLAAFHPVGALDSRSAETVVPFLRRSPFPTLQVVPSHVLDVLTGPDRTHLEPWMLATAAPPPACPRQQVQQQNFKTVQSSAAEISAAVDAILADRGQPAAEPG